MAKITKAGEVTQEAFDFELADEEKEKFAEDPEGFLRAFLEQQGFQVNSIALPPAGDVSTEAMWYKRLYHEVSPSPSNWMGSGWQPI